MNYTNQFLNRHIIVVEDDAVCRMLLEEVLAPTGAIVHFCYNAHELYPLLDTLPQWNLMLLDILLPDVSGYDLARQVKARFPDHPIIAQTACALHNDRDKCFSCGCDAYITKPIKPQSLLEVMGKFLITQ